MMKYFRNNILLLEKIFINHVTNLGRFSNIIFRVVAVVERN